MPFKSDKQRRFMEGAANNPQFAQKAGIKQSVAKKFVNDSMMPKQPKKINLGMEPAQVADPIDDNKLNPFKKLKQKLTY